MYSGDFASFQLEMDTLSPEKYENNGFIYGVFS